jgi:hypothetical protein
MDPSFVLYLRVIGIFFLLLSLKLGKDYFFPRAIKVYERPAQSEQH